MGVSGDTPTATAAASSDPITNVPTMPMSPSLVVMAGLAPSARITPSSSSPRRSWRPITWPAISRVASAAIPPNTPRAMDSGLMARSALASATEVARM